MEKDLKYWEAQYKTWNGVNQTLAKQALYNVNTLKSVNEMPKKIKVVAGDLNGDGVFDKKDARIAGKTLGLFRKRKGKQK